jgi:hypothetical protein
VSTNLNLADLVETARLCEKAVGHDLYGRVTRSGLGQVVKGKQ